MFRMLTLIGGAVQPLGISEVRRTLGLPLSTAHRLLSSLEQAGYIERYQASTRYVMGRNARQLAHSFFSRFGIRDVCIPYMQQIAFSCGETTSLSIPIGVNSIRIASVPGSNEVVSSHSLGDTRPLDASIGGLAMLASMPKVALDAFLAWRTNVSPAPKIAVLKKQLKQVQACGYAFEETAFSPGRAAMAVAIKVSGHPIAAICLEGPVISIDKRRSGREHVQRWLAIAGEISHLAEEQPGMAKNHYEHIQPEQMPPWRG